MRGRISRDATTPVPFVSEDDAASTVACRSARRQLREDRHARRSHRLRTGNYSDCRWAKNNLENTPPSTVSSAKAVPEGKTHVPGRAAEACCGQRRKGAPHAVLRSLAQGAHA